MLPLLFFSFCSIFLRKLFRSLWVWVATLAPSLLLFPQVIRVFFYFSFVNPLGDTSSLVGDWGPRIGASIILAYLGAGLLALVLNYRRLDATLARVFEKK